jgi:hypothetical protein
MHWTAPASLLVKSVELDGRTQAIKKYSLSACVREAGIHHISHARPLSLSRTLALFRHPKS